MKELTQVTRSVWEPQGICGLKGVLTFEQSEDHHYFKIKPTSFVLASVTYCPYDNRFFSTTQWLVLVASITPIASIIQWLVLVCMSFTNGWYLYTCHSPMAGTCIHVIHQWPVLVCMSFTNGWYLYTCHSPMPPCYEWLNWNSRSSDSNAHPYKWKCNLIILFTELL